MSPNSLNAFFVEYIGPANPKILILAGRNPIKNQAIADTLSKVIHNIQIRILFGLGSFQQITGAAATVNGWADIPHIDKLVDNAGIMAGPYAKTGGGPER